MSQSHNLSDFSFTCRVCGHVIWEPENQDKGKCKECENMSEPLLTTEEQAIVWNHVSQAENLYDEIAKAQLAKTIAWLKAHNNSYVKNGGLVLETKDWQALRESVK